MYYTKLFLKLYFLLFFLNSCSTKEEEKIFQGLSISDLKGEWIIVDRRTGVKNEIVNLNPCELKEKLIFSNQTEGEAIHYIANTTNMPCTFNTFKIKFTGNSTQHKDIEKIDSSNIEYYGGVPRYLTQYGTVLAVYFFKDGNPVHMEDTFRKVN